MPELLAGRRGSLQGAPEVVTVALVALAPLSASLSVVLAVRLWRRCGRMLFLCGHIYSALCNDVRHNASKDHEAVWRSQAQPAISDKAHGCSTRRGNE